jgi:hypothetical protein
LDVKEKNVPLLVKELKMQKRKKDRLPVSVSLLEVISSHVAIVLNEPLLLLLLLVFLHSPGNVKPSTKMTFETDRRELDWSLKKKLRFF